MSALNRREFIGAAAGALAASCTGEEAGAALRPPNFVVIFCDDLGYGDLGCYGARDIATPRIDRMAREGMRCTDFYVGAPICSPSRASLLTGRYPSRTGITRVLFPTDEIGLSTALPTIASVLKARGYATACIGKWHLGHLPQFLPARHGFDHYLGIPYSNDMTIAKGMRIAPRARLREGITREEARDGLPRQSCVPLMRGEQVVEYPADQATLTRRYTEEAVRFIAANRHRPFFLYLAHTMPHVPLFASERFRGRSSGGPYGDVVEELDWSTGEVLDALERTGLARETLVLFTSDNGPWLDRKPDAGSAGPLRDGKFSPYEGGYREPAIFWRPGVVPAGATCHEVLATMDLLPTLAAMAGAEAPAAEDLDGYDVGPVLAGAPGAATPRKHLLYGDAAVREGRWKVVRGKQGPELYDLADDPGETRNLADGMPDRVRRLEGILDSRR